MAEQLPKDEKVIHIKPGVRECADCGRRWHGGHDHCCDCVQQQIDGLRHQVATLERSNRRLREKLDRVKS